jgi:hypothetical protein
VSLVDRIDLGDLNPLVEVHLQGFETLELRFYIYQDIVEDYTAKNLTYGIDILNAFSGLVAALEYGYGEFLYGLPSSAIDFALLWTPESVSSRRRDHFPILPSWSWAGWKGSVLHPLCLLGETPEDDDLILRTSIAAFHRIGPETFRHSLVIRRRSTVQLGRDFYTPLQGLTPQLTCPPTLNTPILGFWAFAAHSSEFQLAGYAGLYSKIEGKIINSIILLDHNKRRCGVLFTGDDDSSSQLYCHMGTSSCQLILLSRSQGVLPETFLGSGTFDMIDWWASNVMLISRKGGFAERLAVGIIHFHAWLKAKPKETWIMLA